MAKRKKRTPGARPAQKATVWGKAVRKLQKEKRIRKEFRKTRRFPTPSIALDLALEGGWPEGYIEIAGEEDAGKTTLCRETVAINLRLKTTNVLDHDLEGKLHEDRRREVFAHHHVDLDAEEKKETYIYDRPFNAEESRYVAVTLIDTGNLGLYVVDSIPAFQSRDVIEAILQDKKVQNAMHAKTVAEFMGPLLQLLRKNGGTVLLVNQLRDNVRPTGGYKTTYTTGGRSAKYYSALRLKVRRGQRTEEGWTTIVKIYKNHAGKGWTGEINLHCNTRGLFRWHEEAFAFGRKYELIRRRGKPGGSVYEVPEIAKIEPMTKSTFLEWIRGTPNFRDWVRDRVLTAEGVKV